MARMVEQQLMVPFPPELVANQAMATMATMKGVAGIRHVPPMVLGDVGANLMSWGNNLSVQLTPVQGGTQILVRSESAFPLQFVDYGINRKLVAQLVAGLTPPR